MNTSIDGAAPQELIVACPESTTLPALAAADAGALFTAALHLAAAIEAGSISRALEAAHRAHSAASDLATALNDIENAGDDEDLAFDLLDFQRRIAHQLDTAVAAFDTSTEVLP
ncbi:hypothetical protein IU459_32800 [Nocardia amamiensis]|uniref:Uncharacterized protein n=1 Tax=Nocardia amamiensis TaxID=404578 RepID=A0ABS0D1J1_9NOCA|nr:hypothetical protein [Nocardia amamiensis]MBF6302285.1 hypothetical protein [Nocardia amamiensis]